MPMPCHQSPKDEWLKDGQQDLLCDRTHGKKEKVPDFPFCHFDSIAMLLCPGSCGVFQISVALR